MKLTTSFLILALSGCALAQAPATKPAAPASNPAASAKPAATTAKPAATTAKPAATTAKPAQATSAQAKPATATKPQSVSAKPATGAKPVTASAKPAAKPAAKGAKPAQPKAAKKEAAPAAAAGDQKKPVETASKNRRDPFVSVVMSREGPPCAGGGKKCLAIDQVILQGVVRSPNGSIAVVSGGTNKTFFLRENDPVYNGVVIKIAPDSIIFRETVMDRLGKTTQREVVKKIRNTPSV